jgi:hypothetical protein
LRGDFARARPRGWPLGYDPGIARAAFDLVLALALAAATVTAPACRSARGSEPPGPAASASEIGSKLTIPVPAAPGEAPAPAYPWSPRSTDRLDARFAPPSGFTRVPIESGTFAAFLRALPLLPPGSPVVDYRGRVVHEAGDPRIAAVVDIDVGDRDLQQCADAVLRMNAEWRYGRGERAIAYPVSSGALLSYGGYLAGERAFASGRELDVRPAAARADDDHRTFRGYLDEVFAWANTASLGRAAAPVSFASARPGDFFVMSGNPFGHAVLVLDVARDAAGDTALLLGQSYMPAQSFQVLSPGAARPGRPWFVLPAGSTAVDTPFWAPFPLATLRRLP